MSRFKAVQSTFGTKCLRNGGNMGELMQQYIDEAEQDLLHTYNRYQVVLDRGDGVSLYDIEGKRYLDFVAGIAVFALGYHNAEYNDALKAQIDKVIHTSNYYYNVPAVEAARHLKKVSRMDRVFFTNSGAEAIEGAIKAARKYAYLKDGTTDHEIIAMNHSFHGRTMGALSVTGNPHYREAFEPGIGNIRFADLNDFDSVLACVNDKSIVSLFLRLCIAAYYLVKLLYLLVNVNSWEDDLTPVNCNVSRKYTKLASVLVCDIALSRTYLFPYLWHCCRHKVAEKR